MKFCGKDFSLEFNHPADGWVALFGQRSTGATISNEQVDTTNKDEMPWRQLIECGVRNGTLTASGLISDVANSAHVNYFNERAALGGFIEMRVVSGNGKTYYSGLYQLASWERTGEYNAAEEYSLTAESAGALVSDAGA